MAKTADKAQPPMDALRFIESVSVEELDGQIAEQKAVVDAATAKYKSLLSLKKVISWRDGTRRPRGGGRKKPREPEAQPSEASAEAAPPAHATRPAKSVAELIRRFLSGKLLPLTSLQISQATHLNLADVKRALIDNRAMFAHDADDRWRIKS